MSYPVLFYLLHTFELCTQACPYRLALLGTSPENGGAADTKEERDYSFYYLNTLFAIILCRILR